MKNKIIIIAALLFTGIIFFSFFSNKETGVTNNTKVLDILVKLGQDKPLHFIPSTKLSDEKVKMGLELVTTGTTEKDGKKVKIQSKHFVCTDCHNMQIEDPDLTKSDPEARLDYAIENNLKFLPATTMGGVVNREHWYNDDYSKKYGSLVEPARDTLENAIQLCAVQCSQGRALNDWEMEAVIQYFISIGHEVKDLKLSTAERKQVVTALNDGVKKKETLEMLNSKFLNYSPATFLKPMKKDKRPMGKYGNIENGKKLYELSCLTCHEELGVTNYKLDKSSLTFKHLKFWAGRETFLSVYNITRKGTYALNGYKPYMPNYTEERLSNQQLEDLIAYINNSAN